MRACTICGKGSIIAGKRKLLRGHYNLTKTERKYPNLQWFRIPATGTGSRLGSRGPVASHPPRTGERVKACAQCIRSLRRTPR